MVEVIPFNEAHLKVVADDFRPIFVDEFKGMNLQSPLGDVVTFKEGETPIAMAGGYFVSFGVFQVWALISNKTEAFPVSFHKAMKKLIDTWFRTRPIHRMQMTVRFGYETELRWAKLLGFSQEGLMKKYGPDQTDYWLLGRTT